MEGRIALGRNGWLHGFRQTRFLYIDDEASAAGHPI